MVCSMRKLFISSKSGKICSDPQFSVIANDRMKHDNVWYIWGVHSHGGIPPKRWFLMENPIENG